MIELSKVCKSFGPVQALDDFSMKVAPGSVYGLVGPNGAGKTTVMNHVAGVMRPDSGQVSVCGGQVFENPLVKSHIASIPSDLYYPDGSTIEDMRNFHALLFPDFSKERFANISRVFGISEQRRIRTLSKGMKKQVAFWLALSRTPDVLLLDEPVDGLDPLARRMVWGLVMDEVAGRNMTVLLSSHNLRELTDVCDHVGIMEAGAMRLERSLSDLQENFVKVQVAFAEDLLTVPDSLDVVSREQEGRLFTLVVRANAQEVQDAFAALNPLFVNVLPLSLEEIFIHELGGTRNEPLAD